MKENISAPVIEAPKVVGKIELKVKVPKKQISDPFLFWKNFPIKDFKSVLELVRNANQKIGKDSITISKIAKNNGIEDATLGSIWYSCGTKNFIDHFCKPFELLMVTISLNIRKIFKTDITKMPYGQTFYMVYIPVNVESNIDVTKCIKVFFSNKKDKLGITYTDFKDKSKTPYFIPFEEIHDNGTFETGVVGEIGMLFTDEIVINNNDLV